MVHLDGLEAGFVVGFDPETRQPDVPVILQDLISEVGYIRRESQGIKSERKKNQEKQCKYFTQVTYVQDFFSSFRKLNIAFPSRKFDHANHKDVVHISTTFSTYVIRMLY